VYRIDFWTHGPTMDHDPSVRTLVDQIVPRGFEVPNSILLGVRGRFSRLPLAALLLPLLVNSLFTPTRSPFSLFTNSLIFVNIHPGVFGGVNSGSNG